ncbi:FAD-binding protein [Lactobacillus sp. LC28-10]|uniref:FAD-binding protein n=1 Tax=Secundilactobacillus angelensis TaxID=2722706 RepID=A0ABX1KYV8_9LACO|nr:FAD-binding protein [Secundilactobacillus angelensis]MCH5462631.1 FAD-binding protein [Secundilactobacillus angelensis]NLR19123.1 FAD-binding protein [Secundilactobacillus angelensis]
MFPKQTKYDLVIVGAGLSGLAAAVTAAENSLDTLVIEKGRSIGGDGNYVEGAMGVDSYLQKQAGITIDKTELLQDELNYSHYEASAPHLKKLIDNSGPTIDWLHEQGVEFSKVGVQGKSWPTIHTFTGGGHAAVQTLYQKAVDANIEFAMSIKADQILQKNGHVAGLSVQNQATGQFRDIETANILLATGGYVDNPELVKLRTPFSDRLFAVSDGKSTGDGMQMAWKAGAEHYQIGAIQYGGGAIYDKQNPPFTHMASQLAAAATQEAILWVNERGERFVNEDVNDNMCHAGSAILTQSRTFSILDQGTVDHLTNQGLYKEIGNSPVSPDKLDQLKVEIDRDLNAHRKYLTKADTVEQLAEMLNLPDLAETVQRYNSLVNNQADTDFGKDKQYLTPLKQGPYYAVELGVGMACALGGIRVNNDNEVLNDHGYPLTGLYAAGNDAAGMLVGDTYAVTLPGSTAGYATFSGRNAVLTITKRRGS